MYFDAEGSRRQNLIGQWLRENRRRQRMNQKELSEALSAFGVTVSGGGLSKWETGEHIPSPYQLHALRLVLHAEDPFGSADGGAFAELSDAGQGKVLDYIDDLRASGRYRRVRTVPVRLYTMPASAGTGLWLEGEDCETVPLPEDEVMPGTDFCIRVRGDSMEPKFHDGQLVCVHRCHSLREKEFGIFVLDGEAFIKQLRYERAASEETANPEEEQIAVLVSLNPLYPPRRVLPGQRLDLVGRVLTD